MAPTCSISATEAPGAILSPVRVRVHVPDLWLERDVVPVDLATTRRSRVKSDRVWKGLATTAWHASIAVAMTNHALISDEEVIWATPDLNTRILYQQQPS